MTRVDDDVTSEDVTFKYDWLDRLLSSTTPLSEAFEYGTSTSDAQGKIGTHALTYGSSAHTHAVTAYNGKSYAYDLNGSMIARDDQDIKYSPSLRPVRVHVGGETTYKVAYDGDGNRRKRVDSKGTIHYSGAYERNVGTGADTTEIVTKSYFATLGTTQRLVAFRRNGTLHYVGTDHLGGTIRVASSSLVAEDKMRYLSYCGKRDVSSSILTDHLL